MKTCPLTNTQVLCFCLGWQGGTIHQVADKLQVTLDDILDADADKMIELCNKCRLHVRIHIELEKQQVLKPYLTNHVTEPIVNSQLIIPNPDLLKQLPTIYIIFIKKITKMVKNVVFVRLCEARVYGGLLGKCRNLTYRGV